MAMDSIISVKGVDLTIGKTQILKQINVDFDEGRIHGLIGRNGSGKTMLMKCICGFIKPTSGEITVDAEAVFLPKKERQGNISVTYSDLLSASDRLSRLIKLSDGRANADMRKLTEAINKLCDEWEI
jgi:ABC-type multidrug transport system ATPase subunit